MAEPLEGARARLGFERRAGIVINGERRTRRRARPPVERQK
jgi:hypothetical protein